MAHYRRNVVLRFTKLPISENSRVSTFFCSIDQEKECKLITDCNHKGHTHLQWLSITQQWKWTRIWPSTGDSLSSAWESTSMSVVTGGQQGSFVWTDMEVEMKEWERLSLNNILATGIDSATCCHCRTNSCCNRLCKTWLQKIPLWGVVQAVIWHQRKMLISVHTPMVSTIKGINTLLVMKTL